MATHDYIISNASGAAVRADLNNALAAIATNNSSATEPTTTYAYQWWADTGSSPTVMKLRNATNSGWITLFQLDGEWTVVPFENGTAAAPSIYFKDSGTDTGIYSPGTDQVGISAGGTSRFEVSTSATTSTLPVVHPLGAVGTPSITFTGDLNTGIWSPAADTVAVSTNGTRAITIDSSQRLGIGTTSPGNLLTVSTNTDGTTSLLKLHADADGVNNGLAGIKLSGNAGDHAAYIYGGHSTSGNTFLSFYTDLYAGSHNPQEKMRLDANGRLLVGTSSSPSGGTGQYAKIVTQGYVGSDTSEGVISIQRGTAASSITANQAIGVVTFGDSTGQAFGQIYCYADANAGVSDYPGRLVFSTTADGASSPTERMRIDKDGNTRFLGQNVVVTRMQRNSGTGTVIELGIDGNTPGTISCTTTTTSYNTSSDYRLKENVTTVTDGITRLQQLKPSRFNFIEDPDRTVDGFIAHEVQAVVPEAITGEKDAEDEDGKPIYQGIDQSKLVPLLTAALQEAIGRIETLEAEVAALKAQ